MALTGGRPLYGSSAKRPVEPSGERDDRNDPEQRAKEASNVDSDTRAGRDARQDRPDDEEVIAEHVQDGSHD